MDLGESEGIKFLIRDRDSEFVTAFNAVFKSVGIRIIKTPIQAARVNDSGRREVLDRALVWNLRHLRRILALPRSRSPRIAG